MEEETALKIEHSPTVDEVREFEDEFVWSASSAVPTIVRHRGASQSNPFMSHMSHDCPIVAEVAVPRVLLEAILRRIGELAAPAA